MPIRARPARATPSATAVGLTDAVAKQPRKARVADLTPHEQYAQALHRHLDALGRREVDFFINPRRVEMIDRLIGSTLRNPSTDILNVACGPFAVEFYLQLAGTRIESFDREERLFGLHKELTNRRLITPSSFSVADVKGYKSERLFDVVLINDLFYARALDFYELLPLYAARVKPGGLLYFDIQDERAGLIWRAFGKDGRFRRYDLAKVERALQDAGLFIEAREPALGIKGGLDSLLRKGMWRLAGIANSYVFVVRKAE